MKFIISLVLFLLIISVSPVYSMGLAMGETAPGFMLNSIDGETVTLSQYKGMIVVLIYWRTDQEQSVMALKDGKDFFNIMKDREVRFIGIIAGNEKQEKVHNVVENLNIDFPVLIDYDRQVYGNYGIRVYPSTVIIDREGKIFNDIPGYALLYSSILEGSLRFALGEIDYATFKESVAPHKKTIEKSVLIAERKYNLALKFTDTGQLKQAINMAESSARLRPDLSKTHILLGFLYLHISETEKAVENFQMALELEPDSNDARTGLGKAYISQGQIDMAIEILTNATVTNPHSQMTYYELGRAYELKGEKNKAIQMYKKGFHINKNGTHFPEIFICN